MTEISWARAVRQILEESNEPRYCGDIAEEILERGLKTTVGKTPRDTVAGEISKMRRDGEPVVKVRPGVFFLRRETEAPAPEAEDVAEDTLDPTDAPANLAVAAYGLHWHRDNVDWSSNHLLGYDIDPNQTIDFADQQGVYLLHSWQSTVYIGKTTAQTGGLIQRLKHHQGRQSWSAKWERFSWFGLRKVSADGTMQDGPDTASKEIVSALMEAVLIETLRPSFNQQQGNYMGTMYSQKVDSRIARARAQETLRSLTD